MRDRKSIPIVTAKPKMVNATADMPSPTRIAKRRPKKSDVRPHSGDEASCAMEKLAIIHPMTHSAASSRSA